jgi:hypothetical protein
MKKTNLSSMKIPALPPHPIGNKMVGALTSFNVLGATPQSIGLVFISEQILAFSTLVTSL